MVANFKYVISIKTRKPCLFHVASIKNLNTIINTEAFMDLMKLAISTHLCSWSTLSCRHNFSCHKVQNCWHSLPRCVGYKRKKMDI